MAVMAIGLPSGHQLFGTTKLFLEEIYSSNTLQHDVEIGLIKDLTSRRHRPFHHLHNQ
jgi:hypothetical protein